MIDVEYAAVGTLLWVWVSMNRAEGVVRIVR